MNRRVAVIATCLLVSMLSLGGCIWPPAPPDEAVLAGTWEITFVDNVDPLIAELQQLFLVFDENGSLQTIEYKVGDSALIVIPAPVSDTEVDGSDVTISAAFNGNTLAFNGTLNDTQDVVTGNVTTVITVGSTIITINNGPAVMTKQ